MDGHSKLEFIDIKTNITSILLSLHRFDKTVKNKQTYRQMEIYKIKQKQDKKNNGSITAGSGNLQKFVCPFYWEQKEVLDLGVLHHNEK